VETTLREDVDALGEGPDETRLGGKVKTPERTKGPLTVLGGKKKKKKRSKAFVGLAWRVDPHRGCTRSKWSLTGAGGGEDGKRMDVVELHGRDWPPPAKPN